MSCQERNENLNDFVDGSLDARAALAVEEHLLSCPGCREEVEALQSLLDATAALPRRLEPPRDLWPAIGARIAGGVAGARGSSGDVAAWRRWPAVAAAILILAGVAGTSVLWRTGPAKTTAPGLVDVMPAASRADLPPDLREAEAEFQRATAKLLAALEQRKPQLSPQTLDVFEQNLRIINQAIARTGAALENDPANVRLGRMLTAMYATKVDLLQKAARIPGPA